jgi:hypothetical protein
MRILSHRGYWKSAEEKNTASAFKRSFKLGFGTETDLRDHNGEIVISHDMPIGREMSFRQLLDLVNEFNPGNAPLTLALNVKADGLQDEIAALIAEYSGIEYFLFDMSIPDMRQYVERNLPTYTRYSDVEQNPVYFEEAGGIWLDNFSKNIWFNEEDLSNLLSEKKVCVVSSELHNQDPKQLWDMLLHLRSNENLYLCTDFPEDAIKFFGRNS